MIRISQIKLNIIHSDKDILEKILKTLRISENELVKYEISRCSIDARDKNTVYFVYSVDCILKNENKINNLLSKNKNITVAEPNVYVLPEQGNALSKHRPVIVGSGPAGLFCTYMLAEYGYKPILIEQGEPVEKRKESVNAFFNDPSLLNINSNVQFGEGGAGTFSDGKLNSTIKDHNGRKTHIIKIFVDNGAPKEILFSAKPHIGTDILESVVKNMRNFILSKGGEILFNTKFIDLKETNDSISSITVKDPEKEFDIPCDILILAIGNSSRDTVRMLIKRSVNIISKPFAVGVRVEHLQSSINNSQYGLVNSEKYKEYLPSADYKLTAKTSDGHAVYSFCMCPGGYVINSSSQLHGTCVNGMSYSKRNGLNANSAIVVSVSPSDINAENNPDAAIKFQEDLENKAYLAGNGLIPVQRLEDFYNNIKSCYLGKVIPQTKGKYTFGNINDILPDFICADIKEAFLTFGKSIKGFDDPDTVLSAVETRTSSPVKIVRDENMQSSIKGIYPCGEGAGYAGGITSSAVDGLKVFEEIFKQYRPN